MLFMTLPPPAVAALAAEGERFDVPTPDGRVAWRRFGAGAPVVLLHGGHGSWLHWARNIRALAAARMVLVPDMPGYGDAEDARSNDPAALVRALRDSITQRLGGNARFDLAGFSFGGLIAALWAAGDARARSLALLGPAGHGGARRPRGALRNWKTCMDDPALLAETMRHNLRMHMLHDAGAVDELALWIHTRACVQTRFHSKRISQSAVLADALQRYGGPVRLIWGEHDATAQPEQVTRQLLQLAPGIQATIVPQAGHWVQYEAAAPVNQLLDAWLAASG